MGLDQFVRVLLNLACIKYPDSRDEETAFGFVLHGHVLPYTVEPKKAGVLDHFFDSEASALPAPSNHNTLDRRCRTSSTSMRQS